MELELISLRKFRSVKSATFQTGSFTVLFGKNNSGKTTLLSALDSALTPRKDHPEPGRFAPSRPEAAVFFARIAQGLPFDEEVITSLEEITSCAWPESVLFFHTASGGYIVPVQDFVSAGVDAGKFDPSGYPDNGPVLRSLMLDWKFDEINDRVVRAMDDLAEDVVITSVENGARFGFKDLWDNVVWLETAGNSDTWRVRPTILRRLEQLRSLATDLLPDFLDGSIGVELSPPMFWPMQERVLVDYVERDGARRDMIDMIGQGVARWSAAAVQIALALMVDHPEAMTMRDIGSQPLSGRLLLVDEPEAHLHPSAATSVVRWCRRMVSLGFTVIAASHHEEFLRAAGDDDLALVQVTRDPVSGETSARTLPSAATSRLLEVAREVGMHPASTLSIHRAILFVEGPLDEAALDEYAGLELDAAGVKVIPIHGTRNLEGLVAVELVTDLGIKTGVLTDATTPDTMRDRVGRKRSSEERRVLRVLQIAEHKGLPAPAIFGVPEEDLLFAVPSDAVRAYVSGPFPGWKEIVSECRKAENKGPSDSVDWKTYAQEKYGLPISNSAGVRNLIRWVDLNGYPLPSIRNAVDQILLWAREVDSSKEGSP